MILQRRKRKSDAAQNLGDSKIKNGKIANSDEIYIVAETGEDVERVNDLNDSSAKIIKRQRENYIKAKGRTKDIMLPDVKRRLYMEGNQAISSRMKNNG